MGIKSDEFLKSTKATCAKYRKYMKICFKMNKIIDFNLRCKFQSIWTCLGNIIRKTENKFPSPLFLILCLSSHYGISNILLHHKNFSPRNHEISVTWFLLKSVLKQRCKQRDARISESKWKPFYWDINHQSRVMQERCWKVLLFSLKLWMNGKGSEEQCVTLSNLLPNCHRNHTYKF